MLVGYLLIRKDVGYEELGYFFRVFVMFQVMGEILDFRSFGDY